MGFRLLSLASEKTLNVILGLVSVQLQYISLGLVLVSQISQVF